MRLFALFGGAELEMDLEDVMLESWYIRVFLVSEKFECVIIKFDCKLFESQARGFTEAHRTILRRIVDLASRGFAWLLILLDC